MCEMTLAHSSLYLPYLTLLHCCSCTGIKAWPQQPVTTRTHSHSHCAIVHCDINRTSSNPGYRLMSGVSGRDREVKTKEIRPRQWLKVESL